MLLAHEPNGRSGVIPEPTVKESNLSEVWMKEEKLFYHGSRVLKERRRLLLLEEDEKYMGMALALARRGAGHTRPNPMVGAVLVKNGRVIGSGWHQRYGGPHAEVNAFAACAEDPAGATLYVTLEPCAHYGKTPPCADLIIRKKVSRVVTAMTDPNPLVAGRGIEKLRRAGIDVTVGVLENKCRRLNEVFLKYITEKRPFVLYKAAMSLDGKTACHTGDSQWISSEISREEVHRLRGEYAGIMTGIGTILADDPRLTVRLAEMKNPVRIIADSCLRIPPEARVLHEPGRTILLTTSKAPADKIKMLEALGAEIISADGADGEVDLWAAMKTLADREIDSILLEGGSVLAAAAVRAGIVDKVCFYAAPLLIGGRTAPTPLGGAGASRLADAVRLKDMRGELCGPDIRITAYVEKRDEDVHGNH